MNKTKSKRSRHIGFIISNPLKNGGAERVISILANQFALNGYKVTLITPRPETGEYELEKSIKRSYYDYNQNTKSNSVYRAYKRIKNIRNICREEGIDALIGFLMEQYAVVATFGLKTKTIVSERNDPKSKKHNIFSYIIAKVSYLLADYAVFQTEDARKWYPKPVQKKSAIIFNPVKEIFYQTQYAPTSNIIITCGRLVKQKNHQMLINAMKIVNGIYPELQLHIYGDGPLYTDLETQISELNLSGTVHLKGITSQIEKILSTAEIFVLSSDFEGAPNALMEAMTIGVPSISTDCPCGGPNMLLENNEYGILIKTNNVSEMADAICKLHTNINLRISYSEKAKIKANSFKTGIIFDMWETIVQKLTQ